MSKTHGFSTLIVFSGANSSPNNPRARVRVKVKVTRSLAVGVGLGFELLRGSKIFYLTRFKYFSLEVVEDTRLLHLFSDSLR